MSYILLYAKTLTDENVRGRFCFRLAISPGIRYNIM